MALEPHTPSSHPLSELLARLPGKSNQHTHLKKKKIGGQPHEVADSAQQTEAQRGIGTRAEGRPTDRVARCLYWYRYWYQYRYRYTGTTCTGTTCTGTTCVMHYYFTTREPDRGLTHTSGI